MLPKAAAPLRCSNQARNVNAGLPSSGPEMVLAVRRVRIRARDCQAKSDSLRAASITVTFATPARSRAWAVVEAALPTADDCHVVVDVFTRSDPVVAVQAEQTQGFPAIELGGHRVTASASRFELTGRGSP